MFVSANHAVSALGGKQGRHCLPYKFLNFNINVGILYTWKNKCEAGSLEGESPQGFLRAQNP